MVHVFISPHNTPAVLDRLPEGYFSVTVSDRSLIILLPMDSL
jgi:hypothetical protein